jgi:hypothetical protein
MYRPELVARANSTRSDTAEDPLQQARAAID